MNLGDAAGDTLLSIETFRFGAYADEFTGAAGNTAEIVYRRRRLRQAGRRRRRPTGSTAALAPT